MKNYTTLVLLLAVLLLGSFIWFYERTTETTEQREEQARRALRVEPDHVSLLKIISDDLQVTCQKVNGEWTLTSPVKARADAGAIGQILEGLEALRRGEVISARQQRKRKLTTQDYGLDPPRLRITLGDEHGQLTILVGRDAPLGGDLYIKQDGRDEIMATSTNLLAALPKAAVDLRDRRMFLGMPGEATRIDIRRKEGFLQLARADQGTWKIQKPMVARAAGSAVQDLLDKLFEIRVADFVAESFAAASLYGLDEPIAQVAIQSDKKVGEQMLLLGKPIEKDPDLVYATLQGMDAVYAVRKDILDTLGVDVQSLRDRQLMTLPAFEIGYIMIEEGEHTLKLRKNDAGAWEVFEPHQYKADDHRVQLLLSDWTGARIDSFNDQPGTNLATLGLAPPARRLVFARHAPTTPALPSAEDAGKTAEAAAATEDDETILVSSLTPSDSHLTVKRAREDSVYEIADAVTNSISVSPLYYRDHEMLALDADSIRSISLQRGELIEAIERASATNFHATVAGAIVDEESVGRVMDAVHALRAVDFVAEDPQDVSAYGLDEPEAVLTFGLSGEAGISKSLVFGKPADADAVFAMIKGLDVVFTMEKATRDKLLQPLYKTSPEAQPVEIGTNTPLGAK